MKTSYHSLKKFVILNKGKFALFEEYDGSDRGTRTVNDMDSRQS